MRLAADARLGWRWIRREEGLEGEGEERLAGCRRRGRSRGRARGGGRPGCGKAHWVRYGSVGELDGTSERGRRARGEWWEGGRAANERREAG